jgi:hypothetical protein
MVPTNRLESETQTAGAMFGFGVLCAVWRELTQFVTPPRDQLSSRVAQEDSWLLPRL